ncbi:sodium channel subunit beta-3-like isoform X2 [Neolamprologus brichardi]|uniref:sodium channel subunit beta-3-like isoform X2 n=1 Tax=Neolamprologus brichardi TaxID=32507 RepID=UPI0003EBF757|nr:sodium channel subunit beta-3-like isoform X2 [Neolamprologus brichardi]
MAAVISLSLWWIWLAASVLRSVASESKREESESGQNVTLTCGAPNNNNIIIVEWSRADLGDEYVLLYRNGHFDPDHQHPSFNNRVDLQDRQMKDGDVSLILNNVTINDTGTYECRVLQRGTHRRKRAHLDGDPISIIYLVVDPPGQPGGGTEDGGKEAGGKEDGGEKSGSVGPAVGDSRTELDMYRMNHII